MRRILWLRFNPDTVHHDGKTVRTPMKQREETLKECIDTSRELLGDSEVAVYYLFYDVVTEGFDEPVVQVTLDQDYSPQWRSVVKGCFV
jgi:hypothetical protein